MLGYWHGIIVAGGADIAAQAWPPSQVLEKPFTWTRRLLYVKATEAAGMNYVVLRDDFDGFDQRTPNFNCWWFADEVDLAQRSARCKGQFGVDADLYVAVPPQVKLFGDAFIHDQCEPIVAGRHQAKFGKAFSEKQVLYRLEGPRDQGFLVVLFPYLVCALIEAGTRSIHGTDLTAEFRSPPDSA